MSQQNTKLPSLTDTRITDLREFAQLGITQKHIDAYAALNSLYQKQDEHLANQNKAKLAIHSYYVSVALLIIGVVLIIPCFIIFLINPQTWSGIITMTFAALEGLFWTGYRRTSKYFYPLPEDNKDKTKVSE